MFAKLSEIVHNLYFHKHLFGVLTRVEPSPSWLAPCQLSRKGELLSAPGKQLFTGKENPKISPK
jgi:hypothetical protein